MVTSHFLYYRNRKMYVFVSFGQTKRSAFFGPASLQECRTWLKLRKINPREVRVNCNRLLSGHKESHSTHHTNRLESGSTDIQ